MVQLEWRKSSRSLKWECVDVAFADQALLARDSKRPGSGVLVFSADVWREFVGGLRSGRFDVLGAGE